MSTHDRALRVLVVDDEPPIRAVVRGFLEREGMTVGEAGDGPGAVRAARELRPDVIVLDIMLPGFDGLEVLRQVRTGADPMVIFLTARAEEVDRILGLRVGGDDYLTKPFSPGELVARVHALLRRGREAPGVPEPANAGTGGLVIDSRRRSVQVDGRAVDVTTLEFEVLAALARDPGVVLNRQQLLDLVWGADYLGDDHVVEVHVGNIRRKLGDDPAAPRFIETLRGVGYRLRERS